MRVVLLLARIGQFAPLPNLPLLEVLFARILGDCEGFRFKPGSCSITRAEMRAIVDGLQLAWTLGIRRIQVHSDSMAAITILAKDSELDHQHAADYLDNLDHSLTYGMHLFDSPDQGLSH
ncbi:hypothetical protein LINGRAHAP2_LOCUS3858 [Linum grandiflorum]